MTTEFPKPKPIPVRHDKLYWEDGSIVFKTTCGTIYKVTRQVLAMKSGYFAGLFDIPRPSEHQTLKGECVKAIAAAKATGLDGTTDETALELPDNVVSSDMDHLLAFLFNLVPWSMEEPPLERLIAILRLGHFLDVETGTLYATHNLSSHTLLTAPMRLYLAMKFDVDEWVGIAFKALMRRSLLTISENDEQLLGRSAYRLLVKTHTAVQEHRTNLAFHAPPVIHDPTCTGIYSQRECTRLWEDAWFGRKATPGMVAALLDQCLPGEALYSTLDKFQVYGMCDGCRVLTLSSLEDTPEKGSAIKREDVIINHAISLLLKSM
ncbi:hypothetical protein B0H16DRAFT_1728383 [Mycena metata]|uniref:BTB domain-containing protein n=1 Tax=Mycena metata TaxID=1033252 RepID=A0AAD7IHR1_9AGAR|nr:hypothetical protein B0H16DRAFT_1728383 [Mycena metata]